MSDFDDELDAALKGGAKSSSDDDGFDDEFNATVASKSAKGPLELAWEKKNGASLDATSAEAMKLLTDPATFAKGLGGAGLKYALGAATQGALPPGAEPGLMSMLSTILTGSGTGGLAEAAVSKAGKGAGLVERALGSTAATAKDVGTQTALGAVNTAADSMQDGDDQQTMFKRILDSVGPSALAELGANFIGGSADKLGGLMGDAAQKAKNFVAGSNTKEAQAILDKFGPGADTDMFGKLLDKYSPSGLFSPRSARGHLDDVVAPQAEIQGQRVGQMIDKAGYDEGVNALVPGAHADFKDAVDDRALQAMARPRGGDEQDFARAMSAKADEVHGLSEPEDLRQFFDDKSAFQKAGAGKNAVGYTENARALADQAVGGIAKDAGDELMRNASPETYARWDNARGQKHELEMLKSVLAAKKSAETTAGDIGSTIGSGVIGAGAGALAGAASDNEGMGALGGGTAGLLAAFGLTGGATKTAIRQLGGSGLADFGANVARSGGNALKGASGLLDALPTGSATADIQDDLTDSKGHASYDVVFEALKRNPRMLGSYGPQIEQAEDKKAAISNLIDDDPQFARIVRNLQASFGR